MASFHQRLAWRVLATVVVLLAAPRVEAQTYETPSWLEDRDRAEGAGIRVGNLELHPGIGAEIGYDSNVFYSDTNPEGGVLLRISPHFLVSTLGPQRSGEDTTDPGEEATPPRVNFRGGVSASLIHDFTTDTDTDVSIDVDLRLTINPDRPFSATIFENFARTVRPFTESGADDYGRDQNTAGLMFNFGTDGGVFRGGVGYQLLVDFFEGQTFEFARSLVHTVNAEWDWRFLPQTALLYRFQLDIGNYIDPAGASTLVTDFIILKNRVGINGAFTNKFSLLAMIGYGVGFYDQGEEFESVIGNLEARFRISETVRLNIGYDRDFFRSFVGNYFRRDRGYANFQLMAFESFLLGLELSVGLYDFGELVGPDGMTGIGVGGDTTRSDIRLSTSLFAEYRFTDWLGVNATIGYTGDFTDFEYNRVIGMAAMPDPADYSKFEAWLGVRAFW